jgi:leader peptidase (prepilin peptidase)/N-methyltransferase
MLGPAAGAALLLAALRSLAGLQVGPSLPSALLGGAAGLVGFFLIALLGRGKMGMGDVKLAGVIGLATGWPGVLYALVFGIVAGGLGAVLLILAGRAGRKSYIAYAPYLSLGALAVLWPALG